MSKKIIKIAGVILAVIAIAAAGVFLFRNQLISLLIKVPDVSDELSKIQDAIKEELSAPPPLISQKDSAQSSLTKSGVFSWTNTQRAQNGGLPPLSASAQLDAAAMARAEDMFAKQYFEHVSPSGESASSEAESAGYDYITIGENIALGNFENDKELVQAWMDSPGHRANILSDKYKEIGVAVLRGTFEGKKTWIAVQIFATPRSACPSIDPSVRNQIEFIKDQIEALTELALSLKAEIESMSPETMAEIKEYNQKVEEYNSIVAEMKSLNKEAESLISAYNAQVSKINACLQAQ